MRQTAQPGQGGSAVRVTFLLGVLLPISGFLAGRCSAQSPGTAAGPDPAALPVLIRIDYPPNPPGTASTLGIMPRTQALNQPAAAFTVTDTELVIDQPRTWPGIGAEGLETYAADRAAPAAPERRFHLDASWDNGLHFDSDDKQFQVHVGGNAMVDATWPIGPLGLFAIPGGGMNGVENASAVLLRAARLRVEGGIFDQFDFVVEYDFANAANENSGTAPPSFGNIAGEPSPCNVWVQIRDVPFLGNVRFGNQVKPIGMTNNTYQGFLPFMERADVMDAFYGPFDNGFSPGVTARGWSESERMTWQYGIFGPEIDVFAVSLNKYAVGARVTALPWYEGDGERLLHVGLGYWGGELVQDQLRDRARILLRNAPGYAVPTVVDTGEIPGSRQYTIGPELAVVLGPWTLQAEWAGQFLTDATSPTSGLRQGTVFFHGGYIELLYFLTGEHQEYDKHEGVFGRVIPRNNYHVKKHDDYYALGAWQVGVRFSYLDLNDKGIQGGEVYDWTVGLNWFLNPNMKVQLNYILEHRNAPQDVVQGWINGVGVRAAYDF
jgi:phosphate-selective porin OprO/OprP